MTAGGEHHPEDDPARARGLRTHYCGRLTVANAGERVSVCGWVARRREHGEHLAFVDLRDHTGIVQCVVDGAHDLRSEYVVRVTRDGRAAARTAPSTTASPPARSSSATAAVEVLATAEPPPFSLDGRVETDEAVRLRYRYPRSAARSGCSATCASGPRSTRALRRAMDGRVSRRSRRRSSGRRRPRGRVSSPSRPASSRAPSTCCRRARRSPSSCSWSEASTATTRSPVACGTRICGPTGSSSSPSSTWRRRSSRQEDVWGSSPTRRRRCRRGRDRWTARRRRVATMTWDEALDRYGTDKPDLRFGMELVDLGRGVRRRRSSAPSRRRRCGRSACREAATSDGRGSTPSSSGRRTRGEGLVWMRVVRRTAGRLESPVAKFLSAAEQAAIVARRAEPGDLVLSSPASTG